MKPGIGGFPEIWIGTGTQSHGTVGTGTKICGTVPLLKSRRTTNSDISGQESRSVPGRSRCPGILSDANPAWSRKAIYFGGTGREVCGTSGPGTKIAGLSRPVPCPSLDESNFWFRFMSLSWKCLLLGHRTQAILSHKKYEQHHCPLKNNDILENFLWNNRRIFAILRFYKDPLIV